MSLSGGCLCGAVRWTADCAPRAVHHCHCAMCRRWTGAAFATLVWLPRASVLWTGGEPAIFRSSPIAVRSHCASCGTPLYLAYDGRDDFALTVGSLDTPESVAPTHHYGAEGRLPWADIGPALPARATRERW
jgi:hypothetical protein